MRDFASAHEFHMFEDDFDNMRRVEHYLRNFEDSVESMLSCLVALHNTYILFRLKILKSPFNPVRFILPRRASCSISRTERLAPSDVLKSQNQAPARSFQWKVKSHTICPRLELNFCLDDIDGSKAINFITEQPPHQQELQVHLHSVLPSIAFLMRLQRQPCGRSPSLDCKDSRSWIRFS